MTEAHEIGVDEYPESTKLSEVHDARMAIHEFMEWLGAEHGIHLAAYDDEARRLLPIGSPPDGLVMRYFDINPVKLEQERRAMLAAMRGDS